MKKFILTVTLNPAQDVMVETGRPHHFQITLSAGGKGLNVARVLKACRNKTLTTGLQGGETGEWIKRELKKEAIPQDFISVKNETRKNFTFFGCSTVKTCRFLGKAPRISRNELNKFQKNFACLIKLASHVIFSGSLPESVPVTFYKRLIHMAKKQNVKTILDTSGLALSFGIQAKPYLLKPNLEEAEGIVGRLNSLTKIKRALYKIHRKGISRVILSRGAEGAIGFDGSQMFCARPPKFRARNTVGCGDALVAGFLSAELKGKNFRDSLRFAVAAGAANARSSVPGKVSLQKIQQLLPKVTFQEISIKND